MFFPFSFWGKSFWAGVSASLTTTEPFNTFFDAVFSPIIETFILTEPFAASTTWFDDAFTPLIENLEFTEDFSGF